jgi:hypothetical protein
MLPVHPEGSDHGYHIISYHERGKGHCDLFPFSKDKNLFLLLSQSSHTKKGNSHQNYDEKDHKNDSIDLTF